MRLKPLVLATVALVGCGSEEEKETIKVGAALSTTGAGAAAGTSQLEAVSLAIEQINAAGGVLGKELELVSRDDQSEEAAAVAAANELADEGVPVIFGCSPSRLSLAVARDV